MIGPTGATGSTFIVVTGPTGVGGSGKTGPQGVTFLLSITGPTGPSGYSLTNNYTGPAGFAGVTFTGPSGMAGNSVTVTGPTGILGTTGSTGPIGYTGVGGVGTPGITGSIGSKYPGILRIFATPSPSNITPTSSSVIPNLSDILVSPQPAIPSSSWSNPTFTAPYSGNFIFSLNWSNPTPVSGQTTYLTIIYNISSLGQQIERIFGPIEPRFTSTFCCYLNLNETFTVTYTLYKPSGTLSGTNTINMVIQNVGPYP